MACLYKQKTNNSYSLMNDFFLHWQSWTSIQRTAVQRQATAALVSPWISIQNDALKFLILV